MTKDLEVTIKIRNNRLKEARLARDWSQGRAATAAGVSVGDWNELETLRRSPVKPIKKGFGAASVTVGYTWRRAVLKIAAALEVAPQSLFPDSIRDITQNVVVAKMDAADLRDIQLAFSEPSTPLDDVARRQIAEVTDAALQTLTRREEQVLRMRFFEEKTFAEIAEQVDLSAGRVQQIERQAIRKLRHPDRLGSRSVRALLESA